MKVYDIGRGKCNILIVHGWMHSSKLYKELAETLADKCHVHLIDLPGFGDSADVGFKDNICLHSLSVMLEEFLGDKHYDIVYSHSMGASLLLRIINRNKNISADNIILSNPAYCGIDWLNPLAKHKKTCDMLFSLQKKVPRKIARSLVKLTALLTINKWRLISDVIVDESFKADSLAASQLFSELCTDSWRVSEIPKKNNFHILASEKDRLISMKKVRILSKDIDCDIEIIPKIGHTPAVEAPNFLAAYILKLIEG